MRFSTVALAAAGCLSVAVSLAQNALPPTESLLGSNFRRTDDASKATSLGFTREYHDWALDIGYSTAGTDCSHAQARYRFNPSFDQATRTNFDDLYGEFEGEICPVLYGASPFKLGYSSYPGLDQLERLPVCNGQFNLTFSNAATLNSDLGAYRDYAFWATLYAARYGATDAWNSNLAFGAFFQNKMSASEIHPLDFGQNKARYLEIWNEPDKNWRQPMDEFRFKPAQYAALLSAVYDGHQGTSSLAVTGVPGLNSLGIKPVDPNMKVVFGGLSALRGCYVQEVINWCNQFRPGAPLPFDVVNFHHYNNTYYEGTQHSAAYVWNHFCPNYYNQELQLGTTGSCPERAGLRERLRYSLQTLVDYDARMANKEFWLSETGYDVESTSPQCASVPGISNHEAQAQWLVRTYLEASAAVITLPNGQLKSYDKVLLYDLRDAQTGSGWLFATSGVFTDIPSGFAPKMSYYYLQTYRHALEGHRFWADQSTASNAQNPGLNARVYQYRTPAGRYSLAVWSPTQNNTTLGDYRLDLPSDLSTGNVVYVTQMNAPSTVGKVLTLNVQTDAATGQKYVVLNAASGVRVSETPVFVSNQGVVETPPCPTFSLVSTYCNSARIKINYPAGVQYDEHLRVYYAEGSNPTFSVQTAKLYSDRISSSDSYFYIGGLAPDKAYRVWVVPSVGGQIPSTLCYVNFYISSTALNHDLSISAAQVQDNCNGTTGTSANAWKLFNESSITSCSGAGPTSAWQCYTDQGCSACVNFDDPKAVDAIYFFLSAGLGDLKIEYTDVLGNSGFVTERFRVTTGMHQRWYHLANFANGLPLEQIKVSLTNDLQIGEMRIFGVSGCIDNPAGPVATPVWVNDTPTNDCAEARLAWQVPGGLPADFDHFTLQINSQPTVTVAANQGVNGVYSYSFPVASNQTYNVQVRAYDCIGQSSTALTATLQVDCTPPPPPPPPPPGDTCKCQPIDLGPFTVTQLNTAPGGYPMLGDPCSDVWTHSILAVKDEQAKFSNVLQQICKGAYTPGPGPADFQNCGAPNLANFPSPLSEWFPGWSSGAYPATLRIDFGTETQHVNRVYLYDTNGGGIVKIRSEDANGVVTDWGQNNLGLWRRWVVAVDDPVGRDVRALHLVRMDANARFSEVGVCGSEVGARGSLDLPTATAAADWALAPNPATDGVWLRWDEAVVLKNLLVINTLGQLVEVPLVRQDDATVWLDTADLQAGVYFVQPWLEAAEGPCVARRLVVRPRG